MAQGVQEAGIRKAVTEVHLFGQRATLFSEYRIQLADLYSFHHNPLKICRTKLCRGHWNLDGGAKKGVGFVPKNGQKLRHGGAAYVVKVVLFCREEFNFFIRCAVEIELTFVRFRLHMARVG